MTRIQYFILTSIALILISFAFVKTLPNYTSTFICPEVDPAQPNCKVPR